MPNHSPDHMRRITGASAAKRRATKLARLIETSPPLHCEQVAQLCAALLDVQVDEEAARMSREQSNAAATTKPPSVAGTKDAFMAAHQHVRVRQRGHRKRHRP